ncbi:MAG: hypothetical protein M3N53_03555 [Actinomycetota bacterium]|nr:hypothetical protein [Actinomycetota bacterium]
MSLGEWLQMLNSRVFFWATEERLMGLLEGRMYRDRAHEVITVDCRALVEHHGDRVFLCPINSGATIYNARPRGSQTFQPIREYPFEERRKARGKRNAVVEVAVQYGIPEVDDIVVKVERRRGASIEEVIWDRGYAEDSDDVR